ncbi:unnamed protein product [Spirodela intermedia]|uniref:Uncharacterized protein n=2 Tax=Spirodela intermedia TaxID=51605 RepID=A0A7I8IG39_SPIIN|nr:unnamed protein product [Spirodela intermedia]CAA6656862.1 unnamed protein product [Spirodela intermedia]CAA7392815.1 unnamed protein product [Spirodela intermedia]
MVERKASGVSPVREKGTPTLRRGQIRNRIILEFFRSLAGMGQLGWGIGGVGSSTTTPAPSSTGDSDASSEL